MIKAQAVDTGAGGCHPAPVPQRMARLLVVLALTISLGAHWMFLQSVAWVGMVANYSQTAPFTQALSKTFDGRHPCKLCKLVQQGKAAEKKQDTQKPKIKIECVLLSEKVLPPPPPFEVLAFPAPESLDKRRDSPPTPPPKRA